MLFQFTLPLFYLSPQIKAQFLPFSLHIILYSSFDIRFSKLTGCTSNRNENKGLRFWCFYTYCSTIVVSQTLLVLKNASTFRISIAYSEFENDMIMAINCTLLGMEEKLMILALESCRRSFHQYYVSARYDSILSALFVMSF